MTDKSKSHRNSLNWGSRALNLSLALGLLLALLPVVPVARADDDLPRAYPALLQMAQERPNEKIKVIVQRFAGQDLPPQALAAMSGQVTRDLPIINGFAMELPARAVEALTRNPAVRWVTLDAPLSSTATGNAAVRDEFNTTSYNNDNGSMAWSTNWTESGDDGQPSMGDITVEVDYCPNPFSRCIEFDAHGGLNDSIQRGVDLRSAAAATLTFDYRLDRSGAVYLLEVSTNGGSTWTTLKTYTAAARVFGETVDLTPYSAASLQVRFRLTDTDPYAHLYLDNVEVAYTDLQNAYVPATVANRLWNETALSGQSVTVAVLDSGVNDHADLHAADGSSRLLVSVNLSSASNASDGYGHGTHVAGIIAGNGSASNGGRAGVAPKANLINIKVSNNDGMGLTSDLIGGLQWVYDNRVTHSIRVVNISLNSTVPESYHTSPLSAAAEILWFNGIVVVVSAGNNGTGSGPVTLYPPANDPFVITVGATDDMGTASLGDDVVPAFSAYGTTLDGFAKPDLVAPGRNIISLLASTSATVYAAHPAHRVDAYYFRMSGTSMAAPMVSGAVALLLQDEPNLTPDQVKYRLKATANTAWPGYGAAKAGAGYLDAYAAVRGTTTESANTGLQASHLLWTGTDPVTWNSVNWNSVNWSSVNWNSVNWNSVNWNSVNWNSVNWNSSLWDD